MFQRLIIILGAVVVILFLLFTFYITHAHAFRCGEGGRNLAREGMHKNEILNDCGEPEVREVVGVDKSGGSYRKVEEHVYIIKTYGHKRAYHLRYDEKGVLIDIDDLGDQK
ncbi:DUF2845 domain-containing protein [Candidatus Pacearchaeota archaeon]|nr:DUF2845 domain-containing protein [Candidatus Pacearchaeota archaeon]